MGLNVPVKIRIKIHELQDIKEVLKVIDELKIESSSVIEAVIELDTGMNFAVVEKIPKRADEEYYEKLIDGSIPARNGFEKAISLASKDAGMALAMIGMDHPASEKVFRYLVRQKYEENGRRSYLISRHIIR